MPLRFQAPEHTSSIFGPGGEMKADELGVIELGDEASDADRDALRRAGCVLIADEPQAPQKPAKASPSAAAAKPGTATGQA